MTDAPQLSPSARVKVTVMSAGNRVLWRGALLFRLIKSIKLRRLVTVASLILRGDFTELRYRARWLVAEYLGRHEAGREDYSPVVMSVDPWPAGLPLVSVVVICFNSVAHVEEAVASVRVQTAAEHCEILVVYGGSDATETVTNVPELATDPRARTTVLRAHGVGDHRNFGIERARGRYVACLDANDTLDPQYIEVALYLLERHGYDLVSTTTRCFELNDNLLGLNVNPDLSDMLRANEVATVAVFRRDLWRRAGGFDDSAIGDARRVADWKLWSRIAALGGRITNIQAPLFRHTVLSVEGLHRQAGADGRASERAAVTAYNSDVLTPGAIAESARRRNLAITVDGAFDNLAAVETAHRPTILMALPFMLIGGGERLLSAVAKHLRKSGYRVVIVTTVDADPDFGDSSPWFEEATREIYHLPRLLRHDYWQDFLDYLVAVKRVDVMLVAGSDFVYHQLPELLLRHPDLRVIDLLFNTEAHVANNRRYSDQIDLHLCESSEVRDWLVAHGQEPASIMLVESGIDTLEYRPVKRRRGLPLRVGFSGRLSEEKAPFAFIDLARMLADSPFQFVMTGAGPLEAAVRCRAAGLPKESFTFLGVVDDIRSHLASLDILVLPSTLDGRPVVVLEALALGVPVIASRVGGLPALVHDGETGFLVEPGDTHGAARHLQRLASDPEELGRLQSSARAFAERELDASVMNAAYERALRHPRRHARAEPSVPEEGRDPTQREP